MFFVKHQPVGSLIASMFLSQYFEERLSKNHKMCLRKREHLTKLVPPSSARTKIFFSLKTFGCLKKILFRPRFEAELKLSKTERKRWKDKRSICLNRTTENVPVLSECARVCESECVYVCVCVCEHALMAVREIER